MKTKAAGSAPAKSPKAKAAAKTQPKATNVVRHTCKVAGVMLVDSQVGKFSIPAVKKLTRRQLYGKLADRVMDLGLKHEDGTPYDRNDARNVAYKAKLRVERVLGDAGIVLT